MRNILAKLFIGAIITAVGAFGADNSLGNWKLNLEKSTYNPGPPAVKSLTAARQASEEGVNSVSTGELANGDAINSSYTAKYDGKDYPVTGARRRYCRHQAGGCVYFHQCVQEVRRNLLTQRAELEILEGRHIP